MMCPEATGCSCKNTIEILSACQHLLLACLALVYTEEALQVTTSSCVTAKTFLLLDVRVHLRSWAAGQQQQEVTS